MFGLLRKAILLGVGVLDLLEERERLAVEKLVERGRNRLDQQLQKGKEALVKEGKGDV